MSYDHLDKTILAALRRDSSRRFIDYSRECGIAKSTLHERASKLLAAGTRCVPIVDFSKVGYPLTVVFFVPYDESLPERLCVNNCQLVSPNLLYLECVFSSMAELERFKEGLRAARFFHVVEVLKREAFVPRAP